MMMWGGGVLVGIFGVLVGMGMGYEEVEELAELVGYGLVVWGGMEEEVGVMEDEGQEWRGEKGGGMWLRDGEEVVREMEGMGGMEVCGEVGSFWGCHVVMVRGGEWGVKKGLRGWVGAGRVRGMSRMVRKMRRRRGM
ncbi:hypothetical protein, partial [Kocuria rosea]|uniref:hypothetical protein n=1 Tax=Kocuria rosea TaxID=1275 RepID=UPI001643A197